MFGHWMQIDGEKASLRMGPIRREDMSRYIAEEASWGMQSYEVTKYLGRTPGAPTEVGEQAWWERVSDDKEEVIWGVYVADGDDWKLTGSTSLRYMNPAMHTRATSGYLCFDRKFWNIGVASLSHLARTLFAFDELGMLAIDSHALVANTGSNKALQSVGYVKSGTYYGATRPVHGQGSDTNDYTLVNPAEHSWLYFWQRPEAEIPTEFTTARQKTQAALEKARQIVKFL